MGSKNRKDQPNLDLHSVARNGASMLSADGASAPDTDTIEPVPAPAEHDEAIGKIEVSPRAISHLASRATQRSYGVVGLAAKNSRPGWAELLHRDEVQKGVEVSISEGRVVINLYVIIEYGTRISEVARNIMSSVKFALESALGVHVVQVNVTVQGIRVSN
jgi:uncharacterized alkaline shock family protein YloU